MSVRNWEREGKLAQRLAELGCREVEIPTYVQADANKTRVLDLDVMNSAWADSERTADKYAHRWTGGTTADEHLIRDAAGVDTGKANLTKQGQLVSRYGDAFAREALARYGATLGSLKPGVDPNAKADATTDEKKNPWSPKYKGSNPAEAERIRIIGISTTLADSMMKKANADLAGRPLRSRVA